jgi:hypothetical protein
MKENSNFPLQAAVYIYTVISFVCDKHKVKAIPVIGLGGL